MSNRRWVWLALGAVGVAVASCGSASVGDPCTTPGSTEQCGDDAVCDSDSKLGTVCLQICESDDDCGTDESCSGLTGSLKACHSK